MKRTIVWPDLQCPYEDAHVVRNFELFAKGGYKTLGFWLQKRIFAQGIKPSLFFTKPFEDAFKRLPNELIEKFGLDAMNLFKQTHIVSV